MSTYRARHAHRRQLPPFRAVSDAKIRKHLEFLGWPTAEIDAHIAALHERIDAQRQDDAADAQAEGGDE